MRFIAIFNAAILLAFALIMTTSNAVNIQRSFDCAEFPLCKIGCPVDREHAHILKFNPLKSGCRCPCQSRLRPGSDIVDIFGPGTDVTKQKPLNAEEIKKCPHAIAPCKKAAIRRADSILPLPSCLAFSPVCRIKCPAYDDVHAFILKYDWRKGGCRCPCQGRYLPNDAFVVYAPGPDVTLQQPLTPQQVKNCAHVVAPCHGGPRSD